MDNLIFSLNVVMPLLILMFLGAFLRKIKIFNEDFLADLNSFTFKVTLPILLFNNIYNSEISDEINLKVIFFAVIIVFVTIGILFILVPKFVKENKDRGVIIQGLYRSNFILFGIPLSTNIFGEEGLAVVTTLVAIIIPIYNFMAVVILDVFTDEKLSYKKTVLSILTNPLIIGSLLGIVASFMKISLPYPLVKTISDIGRTATPTALMALGGSIEIRNIWKNIKYLAVVTVGKLFIIPAIVILISVAFGFRGVELCALFSMVAPSTAVSSYTMAQQCDCNHELAGQIVFLSTVISPFSIFLFIFLLKSAAIF
ncbi:MAG TPA: AEC family transporter [Tissierellia bacterium]|nr:AEC family transporter [Tissierellia bacterium]